jgi:hypothetical protein
MKRKILFTLTLAAALLPTGLRAEEPGKWSLDVSLYGLAAGMSGDVTVKGIPADVNVGFDNIWDNLKFGAMGDVRVGYGRFAIRAEVIYMDLEASKNNFTASAQQWMVQPTFEYRVCKNFTAYAGARYNNLAVDLSGPLGKSHSGTQQWWDGIIGGQIMLPIWKGFSFNAIGDYGGFGGVSDSTWQAFPYINWQISKLFSLQAGYRWLYTGYETGSGVNLFKYDILTQGPQLGFALHF